MTPQTATAATACLYCGAPVGSASPVVKGLCEACVASVMGRATRLIRPTELRPEPVPPKPRAQAPSVRLNEALARVVATGEPAEAADKVAVDVRRKSIEMGMRTLRVSGLDKVRRGQTTIEEVFRVTGIELRSAARVQKRTQSCVA